ncbi:MAG TPA: 2'-5' RNA ligase family protein [Acidimicrobiales bacterium]
MFEYARDTSGWEDWQHGYRFGAFYVFPPPEVREPIDALRRVHDPRSDAICSAHISVSEPLVGTLTDAQLDEVAAALHRVEPFTIRYERLTSLPPHPGVVYAVEPRRRLLNLRTALHRTSPFRVVSLRRHHVTPHMAIAEFIPPERTGPLLEELARTAPVGEFRCDAVQYAVPDAAFRVEPVLSLPLGR